MAEDYEWGLTPEAIQTVREGFAVSVEITLTPAQVEAMLVKAAMEAIEP